MTRSNKIRVSNIFTHNVYDSIIFYLLKKISKKEIEITSPNKADLLFIGPYNNSLVDKSLNKLKENNYFNKIYSTFENFLPKKKNSQIKIFFSAEGYLANNNFENHYHITTSLGINKKNHLRFPIWKDFIDWSHENITRKDNCLNGVRFGKLYDKNELLQPQGYEFLQKKKRICFITSHLNFPRNIFFEELGKKLGVDGYGPIFNNKIKNHNLSNFYKKDIFKEYQFNLCPHNALLPGYYDEKIPDGFIGKTLPITWCDENVDIDFNKNCFINLNEYMKSNFENLSEILNNDEKLKKFGEEPLLIKEPNLENEIIFIDEILKNF